ncbi:hypothetical protein Bca4012_048868 [Brassica carinata]
MRVYFVASCGGLAEFGRMCLSLVSLVTGQSRICVLLSASGFYLPTRFQGFGALARFAPCVEVECQKAGSSSSSWVQVLRCLVACQAVVRSNIKRCRLPLIKFACGCVLMSSFLFRPVSLLGYFVVMI